jgi:sulfatase maturation enzyme AslB (radical SAM superfamily)
MLTGWFEKDQTVIDQIKNLLPQMQNIDFYGGEPFLLKNLKTLLNYAIELEQADHIRLHFNTNGSVFPDHLLESFEKFKHIDIAVSIDNMDSRCEDERGGSWAQVKDNIKKFQQLTNHRVYVYLYTTVNIQNVYYLDNLYRWADQHQLQVVLNFLNDPDCLNIDHMTVLAKQLIISKFQNSQNAQLKNIAARVQHSVGSDGQDFRAYMTKLDQWRNQNFTLSHNEIATAMGMC